MKKVLLTKSKRNTMKLLGVVLLAAGVAATVFSLRPGSEENEKVLYSYTVKADSDFRVRLKKNNLYEKEWLESGSAYPGSLTKEIEMTFNTSFTGSEPADVTGMYEIKAVVEGYQNGSSGRISLYRKEYPLKNGSFEELAAVSGEKIETIKLKNETYRSYVVEAERILQTSTNHDLTLIFSGAYTFTTPYGEREETFTYSRVMPIIKETEIFEVAAMEPVVQEKSITEMEYLVVTSNIQKAVPFILVIVAGVLLFLYTVIGTRLPKEEESAEIENMQILKKYDSRLISLKIQPKLGWKKEIYISDMDRLMSVAEELQKPVFYCLSEDGAVIDSKFFTFDQEFFYIFQTRIPQKE